MLIYANNVLKSSSAARSRQIFENEKAFKKELGKLFLSISADDFLFTKIFKNENNLLRKFFFHSYFTLKLFKYSRQATVYSRNLSLVYLSSRLGFNVVWEAHDLPKGQNIKILKSLKDKCKIVSISKALLNKISSEYEINEQKMVIAHDGVDIIEYDKKRNLDITKIRNKFNIPLDKKIILHSGSIMKERGSLLFKDVLEILSDWIFVQVGGNEKDIEELKNKIGANPRLILIPHQNNENLIEIQLSCDALFYMITKDTPTYWCCSPMKIFEFLAIGKPIVASNIGSLNEIINEDVAYIYDPEDKETLRSSLLRLKEEKESQAKAINAVKHVRNNFTWALRAKKILNFLEING